jgi:CpeT protein
MNHHFKSNLVVACTFLGCLLPDAARAQGLDTLVAWMTGSFSSGQQAASDTNYHDIRLEMVRIWPAREDGYWLYVEQAVATDLERPYRQRVYHVTVTDGGSFRSDVYEMRNPLRFAGAWRDEHPLEGFSPDSLEQRPGCAVLLDWYENGMYVGSTVGSECISSHRGASYATSEVIVERTGIRTWDRGYDEAGEQVWGAESGGYVFDKVNARRALERNHRSGLTPAKKRRR